MESRAHVIAAGLFVVALTVGLIVTSFWLTSESLDRVSYVVIARIPIAGLHAKAAVRLRGVDVGKVDRIAFDPQDPRMIRVDISVDRSAPVTGGTYAQLAFQGITGLSYIALDDDGHDPRRKTAPAPGQAPTLELRPSFFDQVGGSGQDLVRDAALAAAQVRKLLSDENVARFSAALRNTEQATQRVAQVADALQPLSQSLPALAGQADRTLVTVDQLAGDLRGVAAEFSRRLTSLDDVGHGARALGSAGTGIENALVDDALPRLDAAADDLARAARSMNHLVHGLEARPQSLVFGAAPPAPGPGEPGFNASTGVR